MADLYVNSSASASGGLPGGSDANDGTISAPFQTIGKALDPYLQYTQVIAEEVVIHLANGANQPAYGPETGIDLTPLPFRYGGMLTIQAYDLPQNFFLILPPAVGGVSYTAWNFPLPKLPPIDFGGPAGSFEFHGVEFTGGDAALFDTSPAYGIRGVNGHTTLVSCRSLKNTYGMMMVNTFCTAAGCLFDQNVVGALAVHNSVVLFPGINGVTNAKEMGICAALNSTIAVPTLPTPGSTSPLELSVLEIRTTEARKSYTAVKAMAHGRILLDGEVPGLGTGTPIPGFLRIVRKNSYDHDEYRGVVLESASLLMGARNVRFTLPRKPLTGLSVEGDEPSTSTSLADESWTDVDTIPLERQIVVNSDQGAVAVD